MAFFYKPRELRGEYDDTIAFARSQHTDAPAAFGDHTRLGSGWNKHHARPLIGMKEGVGVHTDSVERELYKRRNYVGKFGR